MLRKELPVKPVVRQLVKEVRKSNGNVGLRKVEKVVEDAVQASVKDV